MLAPVTTANSGRLPDWRPAVDEAGPEGAVGAAAGECEPRSAHLRQHALEFGVGIAPHPRVRDVGDGGRGLLFQGERRAAGLFGLLLGCRFRGRLLLGRRNSHRVLLARWLRPILASTIFATMASAALATPPRRQRTGTSSTLRRCASNAQASSAASNRNCLGFQSSTFPALARLYRASPAGTRERRASLGAQPPSSRNRRWNRSGRSSGHGRRGATGGRSRSRSRCPKRR